jgi:hypothetical protein
MSDESTMPPDERALRIDLDAPPFTIGAALGHWRLVSLRWPTCVIAVSAAPRPGAPDEVALKFDLSGYPTSAPTSTPWDIDTDGPLEVQKRPSGRRASCIFRRDGWNNGVCLYAPYDRLAMTGHDNWSIEFPHLWWTGSNDITFYLQHVFDVLHDQDYTGVSA